MAEDDKRKSPIEVTREGLYREVWETPISRLAVQYGLTRQRLGQDMR